jgi:methyl-accepting chemotaxis protein/methyl-accepting chemotaxis protein-2 (aspartate sensor receptor)
MKTMTLGKKVSLGFSILLFISVIIGMLAIFSMKSVEKTSKKLANEYVHEVEIANAIERNSLLTMFDIRGYTLTKDEKFLESGKAYLDKVYEYLGKAEEHSNKYPNLVKLKEAIPQILNSVKLYEKLLDETIGVLNKVDEVRKKLDSSAKNYMQNANQYLESQNEAFDKDVDNKASDAILQDRHDKITWINNIIDLGNETRIKNFKAQALNDVDILKDALRSFPKIYNEIDKIRKITKKATNIQELNYIKENADNYKIAMQEYLQLSITLVELAKKRLDTGNIVIENAKNTAILGMEQTNIMSKEAASSLELASFTMIIGLLVAVGIGILLAYILIKSITKPVVEITKVISDASNQVVSASDQISSSSISLAEGASQQASSVEQVSATIEQSTAINNQNAENAKEADILAKTATDSASKGNNKVQSLMKSMQDINVSSERISKIIKTIDEIAFQTNLLALNAAVEAARAGEHGLGFAVVAEEVKNLAQRSATAAKETASIIEESIEQIKQGNQIAKETNESFADILDKVKKTSNIIGEIAISVNEQAEGMNQISGAMGQIDQVTQQNAANSEEVAASAEELNAQALTMLESVKVIADLVGYDLNLKDGSFSKKPKHIINSKPKTISSSNKPKLKIEHKTSKKKDISQTNTNHNEVFPLDEDDLKEF